MFHLDIELPVGSTAEVELPTTARSEVTVDGSSSSSPVSLGPGRHRATVRAPRIVDPTAS